MCFYCPVMGAVTDTIADILRPRIPAQIREGVIERVSVLVARLRPLRGGPNERFKNEPVDESRRLDSSPRGGHQQVTVVIHVRAEDPPAGALLMPILAENNPIYGADPAHITSLVIPLPPGEGEPALYAIVTHIDSYLVGHVPGLFPQVRGLYRPIYPTS